MVTPQDFFHRLAKVTRTYYVNKIQHVKARWRRLIFDDHNTGFRQRTEKLEYHQNISTEVPNTRNSFPGTICPRYDLNVAVKNWRARLLTSKTLMAMRAGKRIKKMYFKWHLIIQHWKLKARAWPDRKVAVTLKESTSPQLYVKYSSQGVSNFGRDFWVSMKDSSFLTC